MAYYISSGQVSSGIILNDDSMYVYNGGTAVDTTVNIEGSLFVYSGGTALQIVENGGYVGVDADANVTFAPNTFSSLVMSSHRPATVHSGTTAVSTTVNDGNLSVFSSGTANNTTVSSYGQLYVSSGGTANSTTVNDGNLSVFSGGTANNTTVNDWGRLVVRSGGTATGTIINSSGSMKVFSGGKVTGSLEIASGAVVSADEGSSIDFDVSGTTASATALVNDLSLISGTPNYTITVSPDQAGGIYTLAGGADGFTGTLSIGTDDSNFGSITVNGAELTYGDYTFRLILENDDLELMVGNPSTLIVSDLYFIDGGTYDQVIVLSQFPGGFLVTGGTVNHTDLYGDMYVTGNSNVYNTVVHSGGWLDIGYGRSGDIVGNRGTADGITVRSGGILRFCGDGEDNTIRTGETVTVSITNVTVEAGGSINGFKFDHDVVFDDAVHDVVISDVTVESATVVKGWTVSDITVESYRSLDVHKDGIATNITVHARGRINGFSFGDETVVIEDASHLSHVISEYGAVYAGQTAADVGVAGWLYVYGGGSVTDVIIDSNGVMYVHEGGSATDITVLAGGTVNGFSFGDETVVIADASNLSNVTVDSYAYVYAGQTVENVTVGSDDSLYVYEGGKVTGSLQIASGEYGYVRIYGIVDFDISGTMASAPALVNDLSLIGGTPSYTITVAADQAEGVYTLADGADGYSETVTICVEGGGSDSITVGGTVTLAGQDYTLNLDSSLLTLTVSGGTPVISGTPGDLNADGRADIVMTIDQASHPADGATGAWLIQSDQTAAWGDLSTRNAGWEIFGTGKTVAGKNTDDVYIRSENNIVGAWTTGDDGKVTGWETVGEFNAETQIVGLGDFNGNGQSDLLLRATNGAVGCYFTNGDGWNYFQSLGDEWKLSAIGDFNGDGRDDVVLKHDAGFAGSWLTQADGTPMWADLDTLPDGFEIVGAGDFNGDGTDDVLLKSGGYYGAWLVQNGNAVGWFGIGDLGDATVEQIADFNGDGVDDLRIRTGAGDLGAQLVMGEDTLDWHYYGSVGEEWKTGLAALS